MANAAQQKNLGAFYTGEPVARWIVKWAVRGPDDMVLDPSCGGGVFLLSASHHFDKRRNNGPQIWGIDVDEEALRAVSGQLKDCKLINSNFFSIKSGEIPRFDAIVGNPPFIRYQSFNGSGRSLALACAREAGVHLPQLSSSWALPRPRRELSERGRATGHG